MDPEEYQAWQFLDKAVKKEIAEYCRQRNLKYSAGKLTRSIQYIFMKEFAVAIISADQTMRPIKQSFYLNSLDEESIRRLRNHLKTMPNTFAIMRLSREIYMLDKRNDYDPRQIYKIPSHQYIKRVASITTSRRVPRSMYEYIPFSKNEESSPTNENPVTFSSHRAVPRTTSALRHSNHRNVNSTYEHWPLGNSSVATRSSYTYSPFSRHGERPLTNINPVTFPSHRSATTSPRHANLRSDQGPANAIPTTPPTHTIYEISNNINYAHPIYSDQPEQHLDRMANYHINQFDSIMKGAHNTYQQ